MTCCLHSNRWLTDCFWNLPARWLNLNATDAERACIWCSKHSADQSQVWPLTKHLCFSHWENFNTQQNISGTLRKQLICVIHFAQLIPEELLLHPHFWKILFTFCFWYFSTFPLHRKMVQTALFDITQSALQHTTTENTEGTVSDFRYAAIWHSNRGWKPTLEGRKHYFHVHAKAQHISEKAFSAVL